MRRRFSRGFVMLGLICTGSLVPVAAKDLFVDASHASANDDVSWTDNSALRPWRSIDKALSEARPGDIVWIKGGPYTNQASLRPARSGTATAPIVIRGHSSRVTIEGRATGLENPVFEFGGGVSHISLENLTIRNGGNITIRIGYKGSASNIAITNCNLSGTNGESNNNPAAIYMGSGSSAIRIQNNTIGNTISGHGIVMFSCGDISITGNRIRDLRMSSGSMTGTTIGILAKHMPYGRLTIRDNTIHNTRFGMILNCQNSTIENNLIYNTTTAIEASAGMGGCPTQGFLNNRVLHNTIYNSVTGIGLTRPQDGCTERGARRNVIMYNVICTKGRDNNASEKSIAIWNYNKGQTGHGTTMDYNLYHNEGTNSVIAEYGANHSFSNWKRIYGQDANSLNQRPVFVNRTGAYSSPADFVLAAGSPGKAAAPNGKDWGVNLARMDGGGQVIDDRTGLAPENEPLRPVGYQDLDSADESPLWGGCGNGVGLALILPLSINACVPMLKRRKKTSGK